VVSSSHLRVRAKWHLDRLSRFARLTDHGRNQVAVNGKNGNCKRATEKGRLKNGQPGNSATKNERMRKGGNKKLMSEITATETRATEITATGKMVNEKLGNE